MGSAELERSLERQPQLRPPDRAGRGEEGNVGEISHSRVRSAPRQGEGMKLLGDVGNDRIEEQSRWRDPREAQEVIAYQQIGLADKRIAEGDVNAERTAVDRPCEPTASPATRVTRARNRSKTSSWRRRAKSTPEVDEVLSLCSSACLKASGVA